MSTSTPSHGMARRLAAQAAVEESSHPAGVSRTQAQTQAKLQVLIESRAIWCAIGGALIGVVLGFVVFAEHRPPLAGEESIQVYGSAVGGVTAALAFLLGFSLNARLANIWLGERPKIRQLMDTVALLVVHASIAVMVSLGLFRVFQEAFIGLTVDSIAGAVLLAIVGGISGYFSFNSGARITAFSLSTLLALFMASGVLVSMIFAENPFWWHVMFSELGTGQAGLTSFWTFNTTLVVSGTIITTLTAFITRDLEIWSEFITGLRAEKLEQRQAGQRRADGRLPWWARLRAAWTRHVSRPRIGMVRAVMISMGVSLAGVGLVPISLHHDIHVLFSAFFVLSFLVLLVGMPYVLPGFPRTFYLISYLSAAGVILAAALWQPIGYYNLTSLELIGAAVLFSWMVVFIRNIAALVAQLKGPVA
ncbi:hypothetical protein [Nesterenkonia lutea]|uniref:ABC transporter permease n=1 Tax=Nesterenkonia lutea TaxID=272919 RepID=A0ABR9JII7_9MICC|nr:hypothetical protein [Nesterenkonia lutea]MBE1525342.1 hypothetical protein [Nesterenkonia lutea]